MKTTLCAALAAFAAISSARGADPIALPHAAGNIRLDGVLDDEVWQRALTVVVDVETRPRENQPALVPTTAYLVENGTHLLVGFDARDPDPSAIRAYLRDRDSAFNDDFVGVVLDTFNDKRRAYEFFANPLGVQMDLLQDDVNGNEDESWDAIWESAGRITDHGFVVEMAIPFSQLRFARTGEQTWGIDVLRFRPRVDRTRISNNPIDRQRNCYLCQFAEFRGFAAAKPSTALEIVPTLTALRTDERADLAGSFVDGNLEKDVGVSVRWGITPDLTADLALNPDFSQVEADVAQLAENTQFALSYPEARPFFLEGADYFATPLKTVFTRTIADPDFGAKLTARSDVNTFGTFTAEDAVTNLLLPGPLGSRTHSLEDTNRTFVGRYQRGFGNRSTIGALMTGRDGGVYRNRVAGIDGQYRFDDQHAVQFELLDSATRYPDEVAARYEQPSGTFDGRAYRLAYTLGSRDWYVELDRRHLDGGFRADVGFIPRVGVEQELLEVWRNWQDTEAGWWNRLRAGIKAENTRDESGRLLLRFVEPRFSFEGPQQSFVQIGAGPREELWEGRRFEMHSAYLNAQWRPRSGVSFWFESRIGEQIDYANAQVGDMVRLKPQIDWNVTRRLLMRLRHTSERLKSQAGAELFDAKLTDLRLTWQFNLRSFVRLTLQRQHVERNVALYRDPSTARETSTLASQVLYSYKLNPQTVLFAGYADNRIDPERSGRLLRTDRTLFLKIGYAWTP